MTGLNNITLIQHSLETGIKETQPTATKDEIEKTAKAQLSTLCRLLGGNNIYIPKRHNDELLKKNRRIYDDSKKMDLMDLTIK